MADIGSLVVKLAAETAEFRADLGKSAQELSKRSREMTASLERVANFAKGGFAIALGVAAVAAVGKAASSMGGLVTSAIDAASALQGLSEQTGASVESLAKFAPIATISGTSMQTVADTVARLSRGMAGFDQETAAASQALSALGVKVKDASGKLRDPAEVLNEIALKLAEFEDGAGKTAIAMDLFGRSGVTALSFLKDLAENQSLNISLSREQVQAADGASKAFSRMRAQADFVTQTFVTSTIPALDELSKSFAQIIGGSDDMAKAVDRLSREGKIRDWAENAAYALAVLVDSLRAVLQGIRSVVGSFKAVYADIELAGSFLGRGGVAGLIFEENRNALSVALDERNRIVEAANQNYVDLWEMPLLADSVRHRFAEMREVAAFEAGFVGPLAPNTSPATLDYNSATTTNSSNALAALDSQLRALQRQVEHEDALLRDRQRSIDLHLGAGYLSIRQANQERLAAETDFLGKIRVVYDEQEKIVRSHLQLDGQTTRERIKLQEQLDTIAHKREQAERQLRQGAIERSLQMPQMLLTDLQEQAQRGQLELAAIEEQIKTQRETRAITEIESLEQLAAARTRSAEQLALLAAQAKEITQSAPGNQKLADAFLNIEQAAMRAALAAQQLSQRSRELCDPSAGLAKGLKDIADESLQVGKQIENATRRAFDGMTDAITSFVKTGKLSFKDLASSIIDDLIRITVRSAIVGPLAGAIGSAFGSVVSAGAGAATTGATMMANGGVMTAAGSVPLRKYAAGGIANTPQLAIFGEGSRPEAFVPLPDGRTIPVTIDGASGSSDTFNITVQVSDSGTSASGPNTTGRDLGKAIASAVRQELLNQRRAGGLLDSRKFA